MNKRTGYIYANSFTGIGLGYHNLITSKPDRIRKRTSHRRHELRVWKEGDSLNQLKGENCFAGGKNRSASMGDETFVVESQGAKVERRQYITQSGHVSIFNGFWQKGTPEQTRSHLIVEQALREAQSTRWECRRGTYKAT